MSAERYTPKICLRRGKPDGDECRNDDGVSQKYEEVDLLA
jgi:hypothetical protein